MSALLAYAGVSVAGAALGVLLAAKSSGFARAGQVGVSRNSLREFAGIALARELIFTPVPEWRPRASLQDTGGQA